MPGVGDSTQTLLTSTRTNAKRARRSYHGDVRVVSVHVYHGEMALVASGLRCNRISGRKEPWGTPTIGSHKTGVVPTKNIQNSPNDN